MHFQNIVLDVFSCLQIFVSKTALLMKKLHMLLKQTHLPLFTQPTAHKILKKRKTFQNLKALK